MVTSKDHEQAHTALANQLIVKLATVNGANLSLDWTGPADIESPSRTKRADQEFAPRTRPPGRSELWPTLVMEAGFSESTSKLESDADWWVKASQGDVRTAVTISVHRKKPEIVIEKWETVCTLQTSTRVQYEAARQQHLVVLKQAGQTAAVVSNGPLVLSLEALFLLDAAHGEKEEIEFMGDDIGTMAQMSGRSRNFDLPTPSSSPEMPGAQHTEFVSELSWFLVLHRDFDKDPAFKDLLIQVGYDE